MSGPAYHYRTVLTHFASDYGPVNLSGIQFDLATWIDQAEFETGERDPVLSAINKVLRVALDSVPTPPGGNRPSTDDCNRHPSVVRLVGMMADSALSTEHMTRVANHPLVLLPISYMAQLAGYIVDDPLASQRWGEAKARAATKLRELDELEVA